MPDSAPRILIVEDEAIVAMEIETTLKKLGYRIAGKTRNGDEALDLLAARTIDLALLDINIRGSRDGIDLAALIRQQYDFPFVFLTAYSDRDTLERVKGTMPYGYIVKPFNRGELLSAIELALHNPAANRPDGFPTRAQLNRRLADELTEREYEVLHLLDRGMTYREVGEELYISTNTVKYYQKAIFQKLGVTSRLEALRLARRTSQ